MLPLPLKFKLSSMPMEELPLSTAMPRTYLSLFSWCGPCKAIAPYVHTKSGQDGISVVKVDVDQAPELSQAYKVQAMPTFLVIKGTWDNVILNVVGGGNANVDKVFAHAVSNK